MLLRGLRAGLRAGVRGRRLVASAAGSALVSSPAEIAALVEETEAFVFDLDGCVWAGMGRMLPGATEALRSLVETHGKRILFATNNSTNSRQAYADLLVEGGVPMQDGGRDVEQVFNSAFVAASFLADEHGFAQSGKKAYVVGEEGLVTELRARGIEVLGGPDHNGVPLPESGIMEIDPDIGAVVTGLDRNLSYFKLNYARLCLTELPNCLFVATNRDPAGHFASSQLWAGSGATVGALVGCSQREPTVVGKPNAIMGRVVQRALAGIDPAKVVMVGDRLDTDCQFGNNQSWRTLLVLSGVATPEHLCEAPAGSRPDYVAESIAALLVAPPAGNADQTLDGDEDPLVIESEEQLQDEWRALENRVKHRRKGPLRPPHMRLLNTRPKTDEDYWLAAGAYDDVIGKGKNRSDTGPDTAGACTENADAVK